MLKLTLRGIRAHVARLVLTTLVVILGVSFIVSVQVLTDTLQDGFDQIFADVGEGLDVVVRSTDTVANPFGGEQRAPLPEEVLTTFAATPGLRASAGLVQQQVRVVGPDGEPIDTVGGAPFFAFNWIDDPSLSQWRIERGAPPRRAGEIVVDAGLAEDKGLDVGTSVRVPGAQGITDLTVVGVARFGTARNFQGASAVLLETTTVQALLLEPGKYNLLVGAAQPGVSQEELRRNAQTTLGVNRKAQAITGATYVKEAQDEIQKIFALIGTLLSAFGSVAMFVSIFIIYNTFSIVVAQRSREFALLRALGAARAQIVGSVVVEAFVVGAIASLLGVAAGVGLGAGITAVLDSRGFVPPDAPLSISPVGFIVPVVAGVVVTLLSSLLPAWRASRIPPVAAMREFTVEPLRPSVARVAVSTVMAIGGGAIMAVGLLTTISRREIATFGGMGLTFLGVAGLAPALIPGASRLLGRPVARWRGITGRLSWENAARSPKRSAATSSAVMIGVALVCLIAVLGESFRATTTDAIDGAVQGDFVVNTRAVGLQGATPELTAALARQPGVAAAAGLRVNLAKFGAAPALVLGLDPQAFLQNVRFTIEAGDIDALGTDGFAITADEAEKRRWTIGQKVKATFTDKGTRDLEVRAIFSSDLLRGTNGYVVSLALFEEVFPQNLQTDLQIYVRLAEGVDPVAIRPALDAVVKQFPPNKLEDLNEFKATRTKPIDNFVFFLWAMLSLAVVISLIGIVNTLLLAVVERTREIGLLRAGGMARAQVRATMRWEAVILAVFGTLLGLALGLLFGWAVVYAFREEGLKVFAVPWGQLAMIVAGAGVAGVVTAIWPAHRAANLDILTAIARE